MGGDGASEAGEMSEASEAGEASGVSETIEARRGDGDGEVEVEVMRDMRGASAHKGLVCTHKGVAGARRS